MKFDFSAYQALVANCIPIALKKPAMKSNVYCLELYESSLVKESSMQMYKPVKIVAILA